MIIFLYLSPPYGWRASHAYSPQIEEGIALPRRGFTPFGENMGGWIFQRAIIRGWRYFHRAGFRKEKGGSDLSMAIRSSPTTRGPQ